MALQEKVKELSRELKIDLSELNLARVKLITLAVISMASVRSINLKEVANGMMNNVLPSSNYRRLQRFIAEIDWSWVNLPKLILKIVGIDGPYTVLIDRTNWKFGCIDINILVIAVLGEGYAIPVMWSMLPKRGNTAQFERIDILEMLINYLGEGRIKYIIGDREFIGTHYLNWLRVNKIGFLLRIKGNMKVKKDGKTYRADTLFNKNRNSPHELKGEYELLGSKVYLSGFRFRNDKNKLEYLIVATSESMSNACDLYGQRWYIENMFKDLKSNGLQLEQTHVTKIERLETLFGLIAIAYAWMIKIGSWLKAQKPKLFKKAKNKRARISLFTVGKRELARVIYTRSDRDLWRYIKFLSCT